MASGIYHGRLVTDGFGNLLADEGENAGEAVAFHEGSYVFIGPNDPSHNERHHKNAREVVATQHEASDAPGYAGTADEPTEGNEHHWKTLESDPHYSNTDPNNTKAKVLPDKVGITITGHTDAYKEN